MASLLPGGWRPAVARLPTRALVRVGRVAAGPALRSVVSTHASLWHGSVAFLSAAARAVALRRRSWAAAASSVSRRCSSGSFAAGDFFVDGVAGWGVEAVCGQTDVIELINDAQQLMA